MTIEELLQLVRDELFSVDRTGRLFPDSIIISKLKDAYVAIQTKLSIPPVTETISGDINITLNKEASNILQVKCGGKEYGQTNYNQIMESKDQSKYFYDNNKNIVVNGSSVKEYKVNYAPFLLLDTVSELGNKYNTPLVNYTMYLLFSGIEKPEKANTYYNKYMQNISAIPTVISGYFNTL